MRKTISVLLLMLMLFTCVPFYAIAEESDETVSQNCATEGTPIGVAEAIDKYILAVDGNKETFWQAAADGNFVGFDLSKEKNVKLQSVSVYVSLSEAEGGLEASYTVQYYRNGRWYDLFTFKDRDAVAEGYGTYAEAVASGNSVTACYTKVLDSELITQKIRIAVSGVEGSAVMPRVYELEAYGQMLENVAPKGKAYASTFKHFDWTPPTSGNDKNDFENDWHGWEPQYPSVYGNNDTSAGFSGEYWGVEFVNREYYQIDQLTFYMSMHNSYAKPSMGYQNTKYKVEALCDGAWVLIAEFSDSDAVPRDYEDYDDAMANDTSAHHIPAYYTKTLAEPIVTSNIRLTINEFAKNYDGNEQLVFPFIYEMRAYGTPFEAPAIVLPEGAEISTDATSLSFPYASSSEYNKYPLLAVDDNKTTGWKPSELTAGQTFGVKLDKMYTVNDVLLQFKDSSLNAPFKIEALVDGEWVKLADGNVKDASGTDKTRTYSFENTSTDELRIVFTGALTAAPEILEISSNIVGSYATVSKNTGKVEATVSDAGKYNGVKLSGEKKLTGVAVEFKSSADVKYYIQANVIGVWQTVATGDSVVAGEAVFGVEIPTDSVRVIYSDETLAPDIKKITVSVIEDSGNSGFVVDYSVNAKDKISEMKVHLGGNQSLDKLVLNTEIDFIAMGYNSNGASVFAKIGGASAPEIALDGSGVKTLRIQFGVAYIPEIESFSISIKGMMTYFMSERFTAAQKISGASGNISIMGTPYANSNYPGMSYEKYICDGQKDAEDPVWVPKLEEYSAGKEIVCGIKLYKKFDVSKIAVYSVDVGNPDGVGSKFEIQALVDGEYIKISDGYTCADKGVFLTVYDVSSVQTDDIRLVFTNSGVHFPTVLELEIYSAAEIPAPFKGMEKSWESPAVTVFKSEQPRFEVAGLPD